MIANSAGENVQTIGYSLLLAYSAETTVRIYHCFNTTTKNLASLRGRMSRKGHFHQGNHLVYGDFSVDLNKRECKKKHDISELQALNPAHGTNCIRTSTSIKIRNDHAFAK